MVMSEKYRTAALERWRKRKDPAYLASQKKIKEQKIETLALLPVQPF
jgi:hypothetical protein